MFRLEKANATYRVFLLIHNIVIHFFAQNSAIIQEPCLLHLAYLVTFFDHVLRLGHAIQKSQTASYLVIDFFEDGSGGDLLPVLHAVIP